MIRITNDFRVRTVILVLAILFKSGSDQQAAALVTGIQLSRTQDYVGGGITATVTDDGQDPIASVQWKVAGSAPGCTGNLQNAGTGLTTTVRSDRIGNFVLQATVTYGQRGPNPPHAQTTHSTSADFVAPDGFNLLPYDQGDIRIGQGVTIKFEVTGNGQVVSGGGLFNPKEKITYTIPNNWPPEFNGGWGGAPPWLTIQGPVIIDIKGMLRNEGNKPLGGVVFDYTQTIGVTVLDACGNAQIIPLGTMRVVHKISDTDPNAYNTTVTKN